MDAWLNLAHNEAIKLQQRHLSSGHRSALRSLVARLSFSLPCSVLPRDNNILETLQSKHRSRLFKITIKPPYWTEFLRITWPNPQSSMLFGIRLACGLRCNVMICGVVTQTRSIIEKSRGLRPALIDSTDLTGRLDWMLRRRLILN